MFAWQQLGPRRSLALSRSGEGGGERGGRGGRGVAASQSNKAPGAILAPRRVGAQGHRLERLPGTAAATGANQRSVDSPSKFREREGGGRGGSQPVQRSAGPSQRVRGTGKGTL